MTKQVQDPKMRELVEKEIEELEFVAQITKGLRAAKEGEFVSRAELKKMIARMTRKK